MRKARKQLREKIYMETPKNVRMVFWPVCPQMGNIHIKKTAGSKRAESQRRKRNIPGTIKAVSIRG